ncbi:MAG: MarR family transcriptional regulator [Gemmatimonadetes bacterium]|nr:MarR family transcriptional regulator [Gemmatimonadota bacterium]
MPRHPRSAGPAADRLTSRVAALRRFNRFYTSTIGALGDAHLGSGFSLTETRVLYELANRRGLTASDLVRELRLNAGYVSRVVARFERRRLVRRVRDGADGRVATLSLTTAGRAAFRRLDRGAARDVAALLEPLPAPAQRALVDATSTIERLLGAPDEPPTVVLREPEPGDLGWVVERHGALYAREYGWNPEFEALVAEIVAKFARQHDPARERCWIAERHGVPVGCVFVVTKSPKVAQLRLLLVEPTARGLGVGQRLVEACVAFARASGYTRMTLWTNDVLVAARRIYQAAGFQLVHEAPHHSFGHDLVEQVWERDL